MTETPEKEKGTDANISRRGALKLGVAAVVGVAVGIVATDLVESQKISNLSSTISTLNMSLASQNSSLSSLASNLSSTQSEIANQPLYIDTANKKIVIQAKVNAAANPYTTPAIAAIADDSGTASASALMISPVTAEQLYNALSSLGAVPGNAVQLTSPKGTLETGTQLNVYVTWPGANVYTLQELITDLPQTDFVFGGNIKVNESLNTGCELCLYSCAAAITSAGNIGWLTVSGFTLSSIVPAGQAVTITFEPQL